MAEPKMSPKIAQLLKFKHIQEVNNRLDAGESPNSITAFINKNGFKISVPLVYAYAKLRKKAMLNNVTMEHLVGTVEKPRVIDKDDSQTQTTINKLRSDINALDKIIQGGYQSITDWIEQGKPISPQTLMSAIKLKNELVGDTTGFLTNAGLEELRMVEQKKYEILMNHLISYIPEDKRDEAIEQLSYLEDEYYQNTEFYEEYVSSLDIPEEEKKHKIEAYRKRMNLESQEEDEKRKQVAEFYKQLNDERKELNT